MNKGQERLAQLLVTGRHATAVVHLEEALNFLAQLVVRSVIADNLLAILPGRDDGYDLLRLGMLAELITVIPLVPDRIRRLGERRALAAQMTSNTDASLRAPLVRSSATLVCSSRSPAWSVVEHPPRERPKACAAWPPLLFAPLRRAEAPA